MTRLTVGTLNLYNTNLAGGPAHPWAERLPLCVEAIQQSGASLVGLQESGEVDASNSQAGQIAEMLGPKWALAEGGRWVGMLWRTDRFLVQNTPYAFPLNDIHRSVYYPQYPPSSALFAKLLDKASGRQIMFYSLHSATSGEAPAGSAAYQMFIEAAQNVVQHARNEMMTSSLNSSAIIVGDTNSAGSFQSGVTTSGFKDAQAQFPNYRHSPLPSVNGWSPTFEGRLGDTVIDRIFVSPEVTVEDMGLVLQYASGTQLPLKTPLYSDHMMISAALSIP